MIKYKKNQEIESFSVNGHVVPISAVIEVSLKNSLLTLFLEEESLEILFSSEKKARKEFLRIKYILTKYQK